LKKEELRATIGEMVRNIYNKEAHSKALVNNHTVEKSNLEVLRPYFEKAVDKMSNDELLN